MNPSARGLRFLPRHVAAQRCMTPLETGASGLVVFTQEWRIERKLQEDAGIHRARGDGRRGRPGRARGAGAARALARRASASASRPRATPACASRSRALAPGQIAQLCDGVGLHILAMKRIRIGRVPLAGLPPGQWRYLLPHERF